MTTENYLAEAVRADGGLYDLSNYISWEPGHKEVILDGEYTIEQLRAIADHMEKGNANVE